MIDNDHWKREPLSDLPPSGIGQNGDGSRLGRLRPGLSVTATVDLRDPAAD